MTDHPPSTPTDLRAARILKTALAYAKRGWHIFPLHSITESGVCSCSRGSNCGNPGKHPRTENGWKNATTDPAQIQEWLRRWPHANVGIACGPSNLVVVDIDPRNHGDETLGQLERQHGTLPETPRAVTGGGGSHYVYSSEGPVKSGVLGLGIDIKADGGYIVAAPSTHVSGRCYDWDVGAHPNDTTIAPVPSWILKRLGQKSTEQYEPGGLVTDGFLGAAFEAAGWLGRGLGPDKAAARCPWEDEHTGGARFDSSTVVFAPTKGFRVGWFWCSHSHCQHGRSTNEVIASLPEDAKRKAREKLGLDPQYTPETETDKQSEPQTINPNSGDWAKALRFTGEGMLTKDPGNAALILSNLEEWRGCLQYDEFSDRVQWARPVPPLPGLAAPRPGEDVAEHHVTYVGHWLAKMRRVSFPKGSVQDAIEAAAKTNTFHPVKWYLESISWDGVRRVPTWLHRYLGAPDEDYVHAMGRWWLVSAVARIYRPGCQADHILVLEGTQGAGKSTAARVLGGDWFLANLPDITTKDAAQVLQGHWISEIGELDALRGQAGTRVKDWLSRTTDSYRPAYGRLTVRRPRSCVFIGTTNEEGYLTDATGGRRFWPVTVGTVDREALIRDRDQLWAEALQCFNAGEDWWPSAELVPRLREVQEERFAVDEWQDKIERWLEDNNDGFTIGDILLRVFSLSPGDWDKGQQTRVGICLRRIGYSQCRKSTKGQILRRYYKNSK